MGLAFSGGGIRSATFNLGILQSLARLDLLRHFDYLSTVSGGGYIGSWLTAWLSRRKCLDEVTDELAREHRVAPSKRDPSKAPEPEKPFKPIPFLRAYSNYLTPQTGFFSLDTWMGAATYIRNLILNLHLLAFSVALLLLVPRLLVACVLQLEKYESFPIWLVSLAGVAAVVLAWAVAVKFEISWTERHPWVSSGSGVFWTVVAPTFAIGTLLTYWLVGGVRDASLVRWLGWGSALYTGFWALVAVIWWLYWLRQGFEPVRKRLADLKPWLGAIAAAALAGVGGSWLLWALMHRHADGVLAPEDWLRITIWGPPGAVIVLTLAGVYFVGLMGRTMPEEERQWWSRVGGAMAILATGWLVLFLVAFYAPVTLRWAAREAPRVIGSVGVGWLLATVLGVIGGRSPATNAKESNRWLELGVQAAPFIFVTGLVATLSLGVDSVLRRVFELSTSEVSGPALWSLGFTAAKNAEIASMAAWLQSGLKELLIVGAVLGAATAVLSRRIDVNEFSMHNFYRDRLTRAYLGASRKRSPNPFSGFDRKDDLDLTRLLEDGAYSGPYPILNAAVNLTSGKNELAWQERKANSFVFTPRHHGYEGSRKAGDASAAGAYRESARLDVKRDAHRISLGTAMTVSGAAVNPNMGYHSSPALSFLLTVFNARLGLWLGNPAHSTAWRQKSPTWSLTALLNELLGQTGVDSEWVNLADGGFFDNLGIYELVRRRCRFILACDAEGDPDLEFNGLGNVIRRCRSDFGIEIRFENLEPIGRADGELFSRWHCAVGTIHYEDADQRAPKGILVYIKSSLTGDEPADILSYGRKHPEFPHESTGDQWFGEGQFESYRRLGEHVGAVVFGAVGLGPGR